VLKSPLFGLTEEDLFNVAWDRAGTLRAALSERQPALSARLDAMARDAGRLSPFAFYAALLGADKGSQQFVERLGPEAHDRANGSGSKPTTCSTSFSISR